MSHKSSTPLFWRLQKSKYRMVGSLCATCKTAYFPPKVLCPKCRRQGKIRETQFSGRGKVLTYTIIRTAPEGFEDQVPYAVGIIEMDEGPSISGQIVDDISSLSIGSRVQTVFRKIYADGDSGVIHYGLKWIVENGSAKPGHPK